VCDARETAKDSREINIKTKKRNVRAPLLEEAELVESLSPYQA